MCPVQFSCPRHEYISYFSETDNLTIGTAKLLCGESLAQEDTLLFDCLKYTLRNNLATDYYSCHYNAAVFEISCFLVQIGSRMNESQCLVWKSIHRHMQQLNGSSDIGLGKSMGLLKKCNAVLMEKLVLTLKYFSIEKCSIKHVQRSQRKLH